MKLLIFSDTHFTDSFDEEEFHYLMNIIADSDQVIINGDFWDHYFINFDQFVKSEWQRLFPALHQKQTIYVYGNHDPRESCDERVNLFSAKQMDHYDVSVDGLDLHIEHGHRIIPDPSGAVINLLPVNMLRFIEHTMRFLSLRLTNRVFEHLNEEMKEWRAANLPANQVLVCGHTHVLENSILHKFLNSGLNRYGFGQYLLVNNGEVELHSLKYNHALPAVDIAQKI